MKVPLWKVLEKEFTSSKDYSSPVVEVRVRVEFVAPSGKRHLVLAFWDGGRKWRVRFAPDEKGFWTYRTWCTDGENRGLHHQRGEFLCVPYTGRNPVYRHGFLRVSPEGRYLMHRDGTPFFWLGDTAWFGPMLSHKKEWEEYLQDRREKGFTVIQFMLTQWRACPKDERGQRAFGDTPEWINVGFFQRMDEKIRAICRYGMIPAPVILWAIAGEENPGYSLPEERARLLAEYAVARYGAFGPLWILGGDGDYRGEKAERWKRIGRAVFGEEPCTPVTMHPQGLHWVAEEFRGEPWYSFIGYQSGHGDNDDHLRWLTQGPPAQEWFKAPPRPVINLEPNYEGHLSYHSRQRFTDKEVRRAAYWSLLVSPPAGITYGHHSIWPWMRQWAIPPGHPHTGESDPWWEALNAPGVLSLVRILHLFSTLPWWRLRPANHLLREQPGAKEPKRYIVAAQTEERDCFVAYTPEGDPICLDLSLEEQYLMIRWYDPRRGDYSPALPEKGAQGVIFSPPSREDWVLVGMQ